jgi:hypothetical protein
VQIYCLTPFFIEHLTASAENSNRDNRHLSIDVDLISVMEQHRRETTTNSNRTKLIQGQIPDHDVNKLITHL